MNFSMTIKKYKDMPLTVKASFWYTLCNIFQKGISFLIIPLYVRILTTEEYGQYAVFQAWREIIVIFATLNLYCGVFTKAMVDYSDDRDQYTSCMQGLSTVITLLLYLVFIIRNKFFINLLEMDMVTINLMFVYFIFYPAFSFWSVRQRVEYKYIQMVEMTALVSIATPIISIMLLVFTDLRENAVIWGYLAVQSFIGAIFYVKQFLRGKRFYVKKYWLHALKFNIPLIPHYISLIVLGQIDRIMIKRFCGSDKAGIYNLAYQVSMAMNVLINAMNNSFVPWRYEKLKNTQYDELKNVSRLLCAFVAVITGAVVLIAPEIVLILGTEEYAGAVWIIPSVSISVYFTFCYGLFNNVEFYYNATKFVMTASLIGAMLNAVLNYIFIPIYGYIAAAYTTFFCYFVFMVMHYIFMKIICMKKIGKQKLYDIPFIVISSIILCAFGLLCMSFYDKWLIRYVIFIIMALTIYIFRHKIFKIFEILK